MIYIVTQSDDAHYRREFDDSITDAIKDMVLCKQGQAFVDAKWGFNADADNGCERVWRYESSSNTAYCYGVHAPGVFDVNKPKRKPGRPKTKVIEDKPKRGMGRPKKIDGVRTTHQVRLTIDHIQYLRTLGDDGVSTGLRRVLSWARTNLPAQVVRDRHKGIKSRPITSAVLTMDGIAYLRRLAINVGTDHVIHHLIDLHRLLS